VFLTARPVGSSSVAVRMRLGVRLRVRMPGRLVHSVALGGLRVRRHPGVRTLVLTVANSGNADEELRGATVKLIRRGRIVSTLRSREPREIRARARVLLAFPFHGRLRGLATALVEARFAEARSAQRRYRLRL
jgi:hypothetical protein